MEDLNRNQIILLNILVSFVVALATSIVTFSLLDDQTLTVSQTINRIVERTIQTVETVVPRDVPREVPVVVTEEDRVVAVVKATSPGLARINRQEDGVYLGNAFLISKDGLLLSADEVVGEDQAATDFVYTATFTGAQSLPARLERKAVLGGLALFRLELGEGNAIKDLNVINFEDSKEVLSGQTIVALALNAENRLNIGRGVASVSLLDATSSQPVIVSAAVPATYAGGPVLNLAGQAVGVSKAEGLALSLKGLGEELKK